MLWDKNAQFLLCWELLENTCLHFLLAASGPSCICSFGTLPLQILDFMIMSSQSSVSLIPSSRFLNSSGKCTITNLRSLSTTCNLFKSLRLTEPYSPVAYNLLFMPILLKFSTSKKKKKESSLHLPELSGIPSEWYSSYSKIMWAITNRLHQVTGHATKVIKIYIFPFPWKVFSQSSVNFPFPTLHLRCLSLNCLVFLRKQLLFMFNLLF